MFRKLSQQILSCLPFSLQRNLFQHEYSSIESFLTTLWTFLSKKQLIFLIFQNKNTKMLTNFIAKTFWYMTYSSFPCRLIFNRHIVPITQPETRKLQQVCCRLAATCDHQADIRMRSHRLLRAWWQQVCWKLSTGLLQVANCRLAASCELQTCCKLWTADLLQVVNCRLAANCELQACCKLSIAY